MLFPILCLFAKLWSQTRRSILRFSHLVYLWTHRSKERHTVISESVGVIPRKATFISDMWSVSGKSQYWFCIKCLSDGVVIPTLNVCRAFATFTVLSHCRLLSFSESHHKTQRALDTFSLLIVWSLWNQYKTMSKLVIIMSIHKKWYQDSLRIHVLYYKIAIDGPNWLWPIWIIPVSISGSTRNKFPRWTHLYQCKLYPYQSVGPWENSVFKPIMPITWIEHDNRHCQVRDGDEYLWL